MGDNLFAKGGIDVEGFDETYTGVRQRSAPARRENDKNKTKSKTKGKSSTDWLVRLCTVQLVLACVGVALLLLISKASPNTFATLRTEFNRVMSVDMSAKEVFASFRNAGDKAVAAITEPESESQTEETTQDAEETSEATTEEEGTGMGGDDLELYAATDSVCFAPFCTTVPIVMPVNGEISSHFGYRTHPITGKFGIHNGTDFSADEGTPIKAAFDGTVKEIGCNDIRGNYIVLSHGGNTQTLYMHCSEIVAPENAVVRQGEIIAKVGSTGWSTGAHLHFSIIIGGKYCNPEWLMQ